jgi:hypothetical protein
MTYLRSHFHTKLGVFGTGCRPVTGFFFQRFDEFDTLLLDNHRRITFAILATASSLAI